MSRLTQPIVGEIMEQLITDNVYRNDINNDMYWMTKYVS